MFETLDEKALLDLGKIDDPSAFHKLSDNKSVMLTCLNRAATECSAQQANPGNKIVDLQHVMKGLISAQNIVNRAFNSYQDIEVSN